MIIHINYEKCKVVLRNEALEAFAKERIGEMTSLIYAQGLSLLEKKISKCQLDPRFDRITESPDGHTFTTKELTAVLSSSINPGTGVGKASNDQVDSRAVAKRLDSRKHKLEADDDITLGEGHSNGEPKINGHSNPANLDDDDDDDDPFEERVRPSPVKRPTKVTFDDNLPVPESSDIRENRVELVKKHLMLLATDDAKFLRKTGSNGFGEWTVDFESLIKKLRESEVDALLLENFGTAGHRLARMLRKLGKLDEKTLADSGKLKSKDVRTKLAEMQMAGIIDIQEVPRDSNRTTARTIFLWFFDESRAATMVLEHTFKAMSRILQRLDVERRRAHDVLALTKRSDVRDLDPEMYLDASQLNDFQVIDAKIDIFLCQIARLDGLISLFRDF